MTTDNKTTENNIIQAELIEQQGHRAYIGSMRAEQARAATFVDTVRKTDKGEYTGYQRPVESRRVKAFATYISENPAGFLTPVVLNARGSLKMTDGGLRMGPESISVVDGQHRLEGVFLAGMPDFPVPFMLFENLPIEIEQHLFAIINKTQKKVNSSLIHFIDRGEDEATAIALMLSSDDESPWFELVNETGRRGAANEVSLTALRSATLTLLDAAPVQPLEVGEKYGIAKEYWNVVKDVWPDLWKPEKGKSPLHTNVGLGALAAVGNDLVTLALRESTLEAASVRKEFDVAIQNGFEWKPEYASYGGRVGMTAVRNALSEAMFGHRDVQEDEQKAA